MISGIVDLGSNTIRLSIYQWEGGDFKLLLNKKEMAGLAGYVRDGSLSDAGILTACRVLAGFRELLENFDIKDIHVFATASLRNIVNTEEALETIHKFTGVNVQVITGAEEAQLSFRGASFHANRDGGLLADIGGGSTELVSYEGDQILTGCSLPMGSLSLYSRFVSGLFPTDKERRAMREFVEEELDRAKTEGLTCKHLCGVGGTIRAAGKLVNSLNGSEPDNRVHKAADVRELYRLLKKGGKDTLHRILRIAPDRVHTMLPGLSILNAVVKAYEIETVTVSNTGVREGYLFERVMKGSASHAG